VTPVPSACTGQPVRFCLEVLQTTVDLAPWTDLFDCNKLAITIYAEDDTPSSDAS
jgi:hypothetical protein